MQSNARSGGAHRVAVVNAQVKEQAVSSLDNGVCRLHLRRSGLAAQDARSAAESAESAGSAVLPAVPPAVRAVIW